MINEIVVVEGLHDKQKVESAIPEAECIVTNGTAVDETTLSLIRTAAATRGIILFLDPDHPGRSITNRLLDLVPNASVAFLPRRSAMSENGRKVGVEHASAEAIREALGAVRTIGSRRKGTVTVSDLVVRGLMGVPDASRRRNALAERLSLPPANAKTFLKWLNMFGIDAERLDG